MLVTFFVFKTEFCGSLHALCAGTKPNHHPETPLKIVAHIAVCAAHRKRKNDIPPLCPGSNSKCLGSTVRVITPQDA